MMMKTRLMRVNGKIEMGLRGLGKCLPALVLILCFADSACAAEQWTMRSMFTAVRDSVTSDLGALITIVILAAVAVESVVTKRYSDFFYVFIVAGFIHLGSYFIGKFFGVA